MRPLEQKVFLNLDGDGPCVEAISTKVNPPWRARLRRGEESFPPL
jgi:hypothetical protein